MEEYETNSEKVIAVLGFSVMVFLVMFLWIFLVNR